MFHVSPSGTLSTLRNALQTPTFLFDGNLKGGQSAHKRKVSKDPRKCNRRAEKDTEFGKKLKLTKEEGHSGSNTSDHSIEHTDSHIAKSSRDSFGGISAGTLVRVPIEATKRRNRV